MRQNQYPWSEMLSLLLPVDEFLLPKKFNDIWGKKCIKRRNNLQPIIFSFFILLLLHVMGKYKNDNIEWSIFHYDRFDKSSTQLFISSRNVQILYIPNLKAFTDNKFDVTQNKKFVYCRVVNIVTGNSRFLLFAQCFQKLFIWQSLKVGICGKGLKEIIINQAYRSNKKREAINPKVLKNQIQTFNSLPNGKFFEKSKCKEFADIKINVTQKPKVLLGRAENIVEKEENVDKQHFLLLPQSFQKDSPSGSVKVGIVWLGVKVRNDEPFTAMSMSILSGYLTRKRTELIQD